jgi:hypothetical protein
MMMMMTACQICGVTKNRHQSNKPRQRHHKMLPTLSQKWGEMAK